MSVEEEFVYTACMGTGCHEGCFLKTFVENGKVARTEQGILGPPEGLRYGICQKGIEYARFPYLPTRLLHPLKRVGERGEGKFREISWDQAMQEIGAKLRGIRDKYGSESVVVNTFFLRLSCPLDSTAPNLDGPFHPHLRSHSPNHGNY